MSIKTIENITLGNTDWQLSPFKFDVDSINLKDEEWQNVILEGNGSVDILNAKNGGLNYVIRYGETEQSGTPSPNDPQGIVCNCGNLYLNKYGIVQADDEEIMTDSLGNTAKIPEILKIGDKADEVEVLTGSFTRRVNYLALTGEEDWTYSSVYGRFVTSVLGLDGGTVARTKLGLCTHFKWLHNQESMSQINVGDCYSGGGGKLYFHSSETTVEGWKQFLADQLANETPVIVVFPLTQEIHRSVTSYALTVQNGSNTISTQGFTTYLPMKASYKQSNR